MATAVPGDVPGSPDSSPVSPGGPARGPFVRRQVLGAVVRVVVVTGALLAVYATAPFDQRPTGQVALRLMLGLAVVATVLVWQLRAVIRSPHPTVRGVEAVAVSVPLLVLMFAATYFSTENSTPGTFNEGLTRVDAAYFSVTVLTTVGFGDIAPTSEMARLIVTTQMLADLVLGGFIAKVLVGAVRRRRDALEGADSTGRTGRDVSPAPEHG
jgi:voltage-gated potassium channel